MLLKDRVALITGGAQGIGKEIALAFAREGANLALCDLNREEIQKVAQEMEAKGLACIALEANVSREEEVENVVKKTLDRYGKIDILVNNAGITRDNLIARMSEEEWDLVLSVNLRGTFLFTKAVARSMIKARQGKIINIASIIGIMGNAGQANYAASKGGVIALTKSVAKELAKRNINVNAIAPGFIKTAMTDRLGGEQKEAMLSEIPLGRFGETEDVARVALFLASADSNYITGQVIQVDGGMLM